MKRMVSRTANLHRLFEVRMEPHDEPVGRSLGARPCDFHVLAQDELEPAAQASLDGGNVDLALPLRTVAIADREQRTRGVDRHIERDRKSTRLNSSHLVISYAVFCLKKKK